MSREVGGVEIGYVEQRTETILLPHDTDARDSELLSKAASVVVGTVDGFTRYSAEDVRIDALKRRGRIGKTLVDAVSDANARWLLTPINDDPDTDDEGEFVHA